MNLCQTRSIKQTKPLYGLEVSIRVQVLLDNYTARTSAIGAHGAAGGITK